MSRDFAGALIDRELWMYWYVFKNIPIEQNSFINDCQSFFGAGPTVTLEYEFSEQNSGKKRFVDVDTDKGLQKLQLFSIGDEIKGKLHVKCSKSFEHTGITLKLIGEIGRTTYLLSSIFLSIH
jgi:hypothetical protein